MWVLRRITDGIISNRYVYRTYGGTSFDFGDARRFMFRETVKLEMGRLNPTWEVVPIENAKTDHQKSILHRKKLRQSGNEVW
jgi:hypothetical protein